MVSDELFDRTLASAIIIFTIGGVVGANCGWWIRVEEQQNTLYGI